MIENVSKETAYKGRVSTVGVGVLVTGVIFGMNPS
jgi:hypothetical protein